MSITTRQAALNDLTEEDTFEICLALRAHINAMTVSLDDSKNVLYWQPKIDAAKGAYDRVINVRAA
jgi:hypothetical protein